MRGEYDLAETTTAWAANGLCRTNQDNSRGDIRVSDADSANGLKLPGWARVDIGARYLMQVNGKDLTLRARVNNNVFDREYSASAGGYLGANGTVGKGYLVFGAPHTVTLSATIDF